MQTPGRRRCPVCRSKKWHKINGIITCSEGHVLPNIRNETLERSEPGPYSGSLRKRTLKSVNKSLRGRGNAGKVDSNSLYYGMKARYHYYQCRQLIFRMQVQKLIEIWKIPQEFEIICRDLWALSLSLLPHPPPPEPYYNSLANEAISAEKVQDSGIGENTNNTFNAANEEDQSMTELLRQNSESEEEEDELEDDSENGSRDKDGTRQGKGIKPEKNSKNWNNSLSPSANIAILVLACWTFRIPIFYMDFVKLINLYKLPYLDPLRLLPTTMKKHLTNQMKAALTPMHAPNIASLHTRVTSLARNLWDSFGIVFPECNLAPLLWRGVRSLGGSAGLYIIAKYILRDLSLPMTLTLNSSSSSFGSIPGSGLKRTNPLPEATLYAAVIIALKIVYGFDKKERLSQENLDLLFILPSFDDYMRNLKMMKLREEEDEENTNFIVSSSKRSPLLYTEKQIDWYISFCEYALLDSRANENERNDLLDSYFPLVITDGNNNNNNNEDDQEGEGTDQRNDIDNDNDTNTNINTKPILKTSRTRTSADNNNNTILSPGQRYFIYKADDILGVLPVDLQIIVDRASGLIGVKNDDICGLVEGFERKLVRRVH